MNSKLKITIPKPCHENWNAMLPKEKGRFCGSCSKTVVDFTKKSPLEIKQYLTEKKHERICGHFYKKQLDSIVIEIPQTTFQQQLSFQKIFLLALFFVMGTTLFSCQYNNGQKQKIENVVLIDTLKKVEHKIDSIKNLISKDSLLIKNDKITHTVINETGVVLCEPKNDTEIKITETIGEIALESEKDTLYKNNVNEILTIEGDIDYEEIEEELVFGMIIEQPPRFKEAKKLSKEEVKKDFDERMKNFIENNFDISWTKNLGLSEGKHRLFTQFYIDENGNVIDIKVRAPHIKIKKEVTKMIQKLPQFIPGEQRGKAIKTKYNLPITFIID
ncbi:energy transducer TonB [Polaribacter sp. Hel_I_88]|uniref:energy transducer TonB n=1 Tax=Polaribacter sp. Hel_I_88 TaxID=1250006 RepID=UPI00068B5D89|nr:energy transducer TonB [Polaribacter sp. Hel_I_88]